MQFLDDFDLLDYRDALKIEEGDIFDPIRKKWVKLTPEESVRQLLILYLKDKFNISFRHILVEKEITFNNLRWRYDIVVYNKEAIPVLLIECKAPEY